MNVKNTISKSGQEGSALTNAVVGIAVVFILFGMLGSCSGVGDYNPLDELRTKLKATPTYSVILSDAKEEGNFFKSYSQKYKVVVPGEDKQEPMVQETAWMETNEDNFEALLPFLGMTVFAKKDGKETDEAAPPGYAYVGDSRYGEWRNDSHGNSFWFWYMAGSLWGPRFGMGPYYRNDYNKYQASRKQGRPYFGSSGQFGTKGSYTKKNYPNFYQRHNASKLEKRASFSNKVQSRIGRNSVAVRSRSSGVGK